MPLVDTGTLYRKYDETVHDGMRLGRNLWLDARSIPYMIERRAATWAPLKNQNWDRIIPILDQGSLSSCTGNAGTGCLGTQPFYDKVGKTVLGSGSGDPAADEQFAVLLYSDATRPDPFPGNYPPTDTGSSGLAICQVLKQRGIVKSYQWAQTPHGFCQLLQWGPAMMGMPWFEAFFQPDNAGFIASDPSWATSGLAGGHEVEAVGLDLDTKDLNNSVITFCNSWGPGWGDAGRFRMRLRTYTALTGVDLKQLVV